MLATAGLLWYLRRVIKKTGSLIVRADELHYRTDLLTNASVLVSLGIIRISGWVIVDVIVSIGISLYILKSAYDILKEGFHMLMDKSVSTEIREKIIEIILASSPKVHGYHFLRTRTSGKTVFIEVHIVFETDISLFEAHSIADGIEADFTRILPYSVATIHLDPYDDSITNN